MNGSIKLFLVSIVVIEMLFFIFLGFFFFELKSNATQNSQVVSDSVQMQIQANRLKNSSDELTRFARTYVLTGKKN